MRRYEIEHFRRGLFSKCLQLVLADTVTKIRILVKF